MIIDVIIEVTIDTEIWITVLKENLADNIIVIDFESQGIIINKGVKYMSPEDGLKYIKEFDTINYYKSFYCYPGMSGKMSTLKKNKNI